MEQKEFGQKLIEVRKAKGLTQQDVADISKVTIRTIQRIEAGIVIPRASTIKIISDSLGFDYFEAFDVDKEMNKENQNSKEKRHTLLWYLKDLFNFKTQRMKKLSILSTVTFLMIYFGFSMFTIQAQTDDFYNQESLIIELNEDKSVKRVEAAFTHNLTLDSLVYIKNELQNIGIVIHYQKIEFDIHHLLTDLSCVVICNDGFSGSFTANKLNEENLNERIGFYRDYRMNSDQSFGTGFLNTE